VATSEEEPVASYFLPSMSALGQLPHTLPIHSCHANVRALPPKADIQQCNSVCPHWAKSGHGTTTSVAIELGAAAEIIT